MQVRAGRAALYKSEAVGGMVDAQDFERRKKNSRCGSIKKDDCGTHFVRQVCVNGGLVGGVATAFAYMIWGPGCQRTLEQ